jgi:hypothetical protein
MAWMTYNFLVILLIFLVYSDPTVFKKNVVSYPIILIIHNKFITNSSLDNCENLQITSWHLTLLSTVGF